MSLESEVNLSGAERVKPSGAPFLDIKRTLDWLHPDPGTVFEIRVLIKGKRVRSGYFDDRDEALRVISREDTGAATKGIFVTVNPCKPSLLARCRNRLEIAEAGAATSDRDIAHRYNLLIDCDPVRPDGISSTADEHAAASDLLSDIRDWLRSEFGITGVMIGDSGNGWHLILAIDLPNDNQSRELCRRTLLALNFLFSNERVKVDVAVFNAARISKLYGTMVRKGDNTQDRPHRRAAIAFADSRATVTRKTLEAIAARLPSEEHPLRTTGEGDRFDVAAFITRYEITVRRDGPWNGGWRWILSECVFDASHGGTSAALIQHASGAISYKCQHDSCAKNTWATVRARFEPGYRDQREQNDRDLHLVSDGERNSRPKGWIPESTAVIARRGVPTLQWDIQGLLPEEDGPAILFGPPGTLKSWISLHLCECVVTGRQFLGHFEVRRRPAAVFVNLDAGKRSFERRTLRLSPSEHLKIVSPESYDASALRYIFETNPRAFIVVDTLADMYLIKRGDDPAESMRNFLRRELRALYQEFECNGLILDHPHRPRDGEAFGDYYGSAQKEAAVRVMWQVTPLPSGEGNIARAKVTCRKMSEDERFEPFVVRINFADQLVALTYEGKLSESGGSAVQVPSDVERCVRLLEGVDAGMTVKALAQRAGLSEKRVRAAVKTRQVERTGKGKATRYHLWESSPGGDDSDNDSESSAKNRFVSFPPLRGENDCRESGSELSASRKSLPVGNDSSNDSELSPARPIEPSAPVA